MQFNWVDWVILVVLLYYLWQGWEQGVVHLLANLFAFLGSLFLAVKFHAPVGSFLVEKFGIALAWQTVLGYIMVGFLAELVLAEIAAALTSLLPPRVLNSRTNQRLGALVSVFNGLVIVAFILLIILALPLRGTVKRDIASSSIGRRLVTYAERYGGQVKSALDSAAREAVRFLTIAPRSTERINLEVRPQASELTVDEISERLMFELINQERAKVGVAPLTVDLQMREVALAHSRDMFVRGYFSHINPEGQNGGDRLEAAGVTFTVAAENLAYAPDTQSAHQGLMESVGHRKNILDPKFRRVGIGVIDSGIYGRMFTQEFTD
ncbi:MAG: CvpA family protein [Patescibacteria group bacterium]